MYICNGKEFKCTIVELLPNNQVLISSEDSKCNGVVDAHDVYYLP